MASKKKIVFQGEAGGFQLRHFNSQRGDGLGQGVGSSLDDVQRGLGVLQSHSRRFKIGAS